MFTIESLWKIEALSPLKKVYETNPNDRRVVVVANADGGVNTKETEDLHLWLEQQQYQSIPAEWETESLDILQIIHVSQLSVQVLRGNPFSLTPEPLTPNSWLNRLEQNRFDAILLAQELGDIQRQPMRIDIKDKIKPALESEALSDFWQEAINHVLFAKSGDAPKNAEQKRVLTAWQRVERRRHYDSTEKGVPSTSTHQVTHTQAQVYEWGINQHRWNHRHTKLSEWIVNHIASPDDLPPIAMQIFGTVSRIAWSRKIKNDAHSIVHEAMLQGKLDELASYFGFVQAIEDDSVSHSPFNQSGQTVYGAQVNTGGSAIISGDVVVGGDFIGGDKVVGDKIVTATSGSSQVAEGRNITQTTIITRKK